MNHEELLRTGGPAFPVEKSHDFPGISGAGMTLRDWFAGQVLAGWMANNDAALLEAERDGMRASRCYQLADAMLAARKESEW